ncbi:MAG: sugar phosphate nucleotidyltransferase [Bacteroidales bacterium]
MKIIIPMAGMGKRMRPHTLTTPKPLIHLAGKAIVEHLIEEIASVVKEPIDEVAFIVGHFGTEVEQTLLLAAQRIGAKGSIYYQEEALGTAHAILCAAPSLEGKVVVAFADTLFFAKFDISSDKEAIIWTHHVADPSAFGVVLTNENGQITGFKEKPATFVSDQAIIGIYYFKDGHNLASELQYLIDQDIRKGLEYQLTDALQNMMEKGMLFYSENVDEWLDCGNKDATVATNQRVLIHKTATQYIAPSVELKQSQIIPPCYIAQGVKIENSIVGPYVSIGENAIISHSVIDNSILQTSVNIQHCNLSNSMLGNSAKVKGKSCQLSLSDFSELHF